MILVPDDETEGREFRQMLHDTGFRTAVWSEGEMPDETTQILLADTRGEMGLWYRLAPVTFMGSSLMPGHGGRDPYEPAALGSAILYGPNVGRYLAAYSRFAAAGAARIVKDSDSLAAAVQQCLAPDKAAQMATAGWEVASEGAEVTDAFRWASTRVARRGAAIDATRRAMSSTSSRSSSPMRGSACW